MVYINDRSTELYYDENYEERLKLLDPDSLKEELDQLDHDLMILSSLGVSDSYCKFDYVIRKTSNPMFGRNNLMQCSECGQQYFSYKGHKVQECNETKFKTSLDKFEDQLKLKNDNINSKRCISDRILLYLRYGFDTLSFKDVKEKEDYVNRSVDLYKRIRGNELYQGKNPRIIAAAIIYTVHVQIGIEKYGGDEKEYFQNVSSLRHGLITQRKIHEVFNVSKVAIQKIWKFIRETENI